MTPPDSRSDKGRTARPPRPCPICKKMSISEYFPFCSKRCADVDLNRWLKQSYAIPAIEPPDEWSPDRDADTDANGDGVPASGARRDDWEPESGR